MTKRYNELVAIQATFSRVIQQYSLMHHYRWRENGKQGKTGTLRGYDMHRHLPIDQVMHSLADAYAPAVITIWQKITKGCVAYYFQLEVNARPEMLDLDGEWRVWAQW